MFEQYNIFDKAARIIIFAVLAYLSLAFIPEQKLNMEDICKIVSAMTLVFIIYDFYYPPVRIELKNDDKDK
jgi:hypothetical protein